MISLLLLQVIYAIARTVPEANGMIITGPGSNMSAIMRDAGSQETEQKMNTLPPIHFNDNWNWKEPVTDAAVRRKFLKNFLAALRATFLRDDSNAINKESLQNTDGEHFDETDKLYVEEHKNNNDGQFSATENINIDNEEFTFTSNDFTDYEEDPLFNNDLIQPKRDHKNILRTAAIIAAHKEQRKLREKAKNDARESAAKIRQEQARITLIQTQHDDRVKEITEFINVNKLGAQYIHEEVRRIKRSGVARDALRRIVEYLEVPGNEKLRSSVLKCFFKRRNIHIREHGFWKGRITNNLIIDVVKDPFNEGV